MKCIINIYPDADDKIECKNLRLTGGTVPVLRIGDANIFASPEQLDEIEGACGAWLTNNLVAEDITPIPAEAATDAPCCCEPVGIGSITISKWDGSDFQVFVPAGPDDMPRIGEDGFYLLPDGKGTIIRDPNSPSGYWNLWIKGGNKTSHRTPQAAWDYFKSIGPRVDADDMIEAITSTFKVVQ